MKWSHHRSVYHQEHPSTIPRSHIPDSSSPMRFTAARLQLLQGFTPTVNRMALHQAKSDKLICELSCPHSHQHTRMTSNP